MMLDRVELPVGAVPVVNPATEQDKAAATALPPPIFPKAKRQSKKTREALAAHYSQGWHDGWGECLARDKAPDMLGILLLMALAAGSGFGLGVWLL